METPQQYYRGEASMSAPGSQDSALRELPREIGALRDIIQGVLIHADLAPWLYDVKFSEQRYDDKHVRPVAEVLSRIRELSAQPLTFARKPADRLATVCRHFSLLLCAILRQQGVPARTRVGFGAYFNAGKFEDHWVCEYWNAQQARWTLVDAQLDEIQRKTFKIDFDPLDVPHNRFIIAGDGWQMCRSGRADAKDFGLSPANLKGWWFIGGNVLRDFAALNRVELLPWDVWGAMPPPDAELTEENQMLIDHVAALTLAEDEAFPEIRKLYDTDDRLRAPGTVFNALRNRPEQIRA
jgi:hypothetical protein